MCCTVTVLCLHCRMEKAALYGSNGTQLERRESNQTAQMCGWSIEILMVYVCWLFIAVHFISTLVLRWFSHVSDGVWCPWFVSGCITCGKTSIFPLQFIPIATHAVPANSPLGNTAIKTLVSSSLMEWKTGSGSPIKQYCIKYSRQALWTRSQLDFCEAGLEGNRITKGFSATSSLAWAWTLLNQRAEWNVLRQSPKIRKHSKWLGNDVPLHVYEAKLPSWLYFCPSFILISISRMNVKTIHNYYCRNRRLQSSL